jgi:hypothetical protein
MALMPIDPKDRKYMILGLKIAGDFGASIAIPVIVFVVIGKWLDTKYGLWPFFTVFAFVIAGLISAGSIKKKAYKYGKDFENLDKKENKEN